MLNDLHTIDHFAYPKLVKDKKWSISDKYISKYVQPKAGMAKKLGLYK